MDKFIELVGPRDGKFTIGNFVRVVLRIEDEKTARAFYEGYLQWQSDQPPVDRYTPGELVQSNIGWCFGEGMRSDLIAMWVKVCGASHPVFGNVMPTAEEAFQAGVAYAVTEES